MGDRRPPAPPPCIECCLIPHDKCTEGRKGGGRVPPALSLSLRLRPPLAPAHQYAPPTDKCSGDCDGGQGGHGHRGLAMEPLKFLGMTF